MVNKVFNRLEKDLIYIRKVCENFGPNPDEYIHFLSWIDQLASQIEKGTRPEKDLLIIRKAFGKALNSLETVQGFGALKPHGYAGDFEIIDKIYLRYVSEKEEYRKYDLFFHDQAAPKAVRNRKRYFKDLLELKTRTGNISILNLASGPCRGISEFMRMHPTRSFEMDCIEIDQKAIAYAKRLIPKSELGNINFIEQDILKFIPKKKYDLIWSAGLFDYFNDTLFHRILNRLLKFVNENGEIIIGNFHPRNPSRAYMEIIGQWYLNHRSNEELYELSKFAGIKNDHRIDIDEEKEGVNLFLRLKF